jgi:ferredoxin-NADP reductase
MGFEVSWTQARVVAAREVTPTVRAIDLAPLDGARRFQPGAHINIEVAIDGRRDLRHYSVVGEHPHDGAYRVAVRRVRDTRGGSAFMWALEPAAQVPISHPHTLFELSHGAPEYLLIAGGIGITPIVGMAYNLTRAGADFRLLYGGRERADMPFCAELSERLGDRLELFPDDEHRHINLEAEFAKLHPEGEVYVCGPMGMLDDLERVEPAHSG